MSKSKVSYVMASYNHEEYIREQILSILNQSYDALELIVVDDGSMDKTAAVAKEAASGDSRMQLFVQENLGVVHARNRGVELSTGEYVSVVDSDDVLPVERTQWMVDMLDANPDASMVYGDAWIIDASGQKKCRFFDIYPPVDGEFSTVLFLNYCFVPAVSVMFRRLSFDVSGPFWGPGAHTDYLKWIELGMVGAPLRIQNKQLGYWRIHGRNVTKESGRLKIHHYEQLRHSLEALLQRHPDLSSGIEPKQLNQRYSRCHFMGAYYAGFDNAWQEARSQFHKAFKLHPSIMNLFALISAQPVIYLFCAPIYRLVKRIRKLQ